MKKIFSIQRQTLYNAIIIAFILLPVIIDQVNGFLQFRLGVGFSISQYIKSVYTLFLLFFSFSQFFLFGRTGSVSGILLTVFLFFNIIISNILFHDRSSYLLTDVIFFSKILTFPISYAFFFYLYKKEPGHFQFIYRTSYLILAIILFLAIILSLFGFGMLNYGMGDGDIELGYRGFFIAGNEVGALFILVYSFWFFDLLQNNHPFWKLFAGTLVGMLVAGLIVSKTAIGSFVFVTLFTPLFLKLKTRTFFRFSVYDKRMALIFSLLMVISTTIIYVLFHDRIIANIERIQFNISRAESFNSFLLSGRDERFENSWRLFNQYSTIEKLIGTGWSYPQEVISRKFLGDGSSEVDYLDILVSYGIIGVLLIYSFWILISFKIIKKFILGRDVYIVPILISFFLLFINSFLSGHIIYSAMVGFYLGLLISKVEVIR